MPNNVTAGVEILKQIKQGYVTGDLAEARENLEAAKARLAHLQDSFDRYKGNNPNKYRSDIKSARADIELTEYKIKWLLSLELQDHYERGERSLTEREIENRRAVLAKRTPSPTALKGLRNITGD